MTIWASQKLLDFLQTQSSHKLNLHHMTQRATRGILQDLALCTDVSTSRCFFSTRFLYDAALLIFLFLHAKLWPNQVRTSWSYCKICHRWCLLLFTSEDRSLPAKILVAICHLTNAAIRSCPRQGLYPSAWNLKGFPGVVHESDMYFEPNLCLLTCAQTVQLL